LSKGLLLLTIIEVFVTITMISLSVYILIYKRYINSKIKKGRLKGKNLIETAAGIVMNNFRNEKMLWKLNINSLKSIDEKIDDELKKNSSGDTINKADMIFMLGCYLGEVLRYSAGAKWIDDKTAKFPATMKMKNGEIIMPFEKIKKRMLNGNPDNIYDYGYVIKNYK